MEISFNENLNQEQLEQLYRDDEKCLAYLSDLKWKNGFVCKKCGNENCCDGKVPFSRRCTRCKNEESSTANTLFHNIKFPVSKAFQITYSVIKNNRISTYELSQKLDLRQVTCWNFRNRVEERLIRLSNQVYEGKLKMTDVLVGNVESPFDL